MHSSKTYQYLIVTDSNSGQLFKTKQFVSLGTVIRVFSVDNGYEIFKWQSFKGYS